MGALRKAPVASGRSRLRAGMRLPEQEVSGEGAGQESRGQRGAVTPLGRPRSALTTALSPRRSWSGARAEARAAASLGAWLPSERGRPAGLSSVRGRAEPGSGRSAASALGLVFR